MSNPPDIGHALVLRAVLDGLPSTLSARDVRARKWLRIAIHELEATGSPQEALERVGSLMSTEYTKAPQ